MLKASVPKNVVEAIVLVLDITDLSIFSEKDKYNELTTRSKLHSLSDVAWRGLARRCVARR